MDDSDSDDDCQLYSRKAEHFIMKREEIQAKRRELEKVIDFLHVDEVETALSYDNVSNHPEAHKEEFKKVEPNVDASPICIEDLSSADEDDIPLAELSRTLRSNKRRKQSSVPPPKRKSIRKSRKQKNKDPSTSQTRDLGVIVLDDDTGYPMTSLPPIDFKRRSHNKSNLSDDVLANISLDTLINEDAEEVELIENDDLVTLTIEWNNSLKTTRKEFKLRRYQKFESVFEELAKIENISVNRVLLMYDFKSINPADTPSSLNLKFYGALIGSVSASEINRDRVNFNCYNSNDNLSEPSGIQVKLLLQSKQTLLFRVLKNQKMDSLYKKCAEELKCEKSKLRFTFDGEYVEPSDLVSDLDIEDGDVFHVHVK